MRAEAPVPSIRGAYINPSKAWIIRTYGREVFSQALSSLSPEQQAAFGGELVSLSWYPLGDWTRLLDSVRAHVWTTQREDEATFDRRHIYGSISTTMQTVYRIAFGLFSPQTVVAKVTPYFKRVYSHGEYEVIENEASRCLLRFSDAPSEMLPEIKRNFPIAAGWMLYTAKQQVTRQELTPRVYGPTFSCDLELHYQAMKG
jgi:hypothetical protein